MSAPKTEAELADKMRALVDWIVTICGDPCSCPLSDEERIIFVRSAHYRAKEIRDTEIFLRAQLVKAAADSAAITNTYIVPPYTKKPKRKHPIHQEPAPAAATGGEKE